eukprot:55817_1
MQRLMILKTWLVFLFAIYLLQSTSAQLVSYENITCGDIITNTIDYYNESHYYQLIINETYNINFDDCLSDADIYVLIEDSLQNDMIGDNCPNGDWCGYCMNGGNYAENFTIKNMTPGIYSMEIFPFSVDAGSYIFSVNCIPISNNPSIKHKVCDNENGRKYQITQNQIIFSSFQIWDDTIEMSFDVKVNQHCNLNTCNILSIGNNYGSGYEYKFLSLDIKGVENLLELSIDYVTYTTSTTTIYFPNVDTLLPVDDKYHTIYFSYAFTANISNPTQNINYFSIDNDSHYFVSNVPSKVPQTQIYQLYFSAPYPDAINATVSNICISSAMIITGEIKCDDDFTGTLLSGVDIDYYYFNSTGNHNALSVLFDSCNSSYDTYLYLYDMHFNALYQGDDHGDCGVKEQLFISTLNPGEYILGISGYKFEYNDHFVHEYGDWNIKLSCSNDTSTNKKKSPYILRRRDFWPDWFPGEICEYTYGTTLATINTEDDKFEALDLIKSSLNDYQISGTSIDFWIGMYRDPTTNNQWQWLDGTNCNVNYTGIGGCGNNVNWNQSRPLPVNNFTYSTSYSDSTVPIFGSILVVTNNTIAAIIDEPFQYFQEFDERFWRWYLCNAPNSRYSPTDCTEQLNCWTKHDCCNDMILNTDTLTQQTFLGTSFQPSIAYWNSQLFIVGTNQIHFANIEQLNGQYTWNKIKYQRKNVSSYEPYRYYQYRSSLYRLYQTENVGNMTWLDVDADVEYDYILERIDLNTFNVTYYKTSETTGKFIHCMVAGGDRVYLIRIRDILVYNINQNTWHISTYDDITLQSLVVFFDFQPIACTITANHRFIYIFSQAYLIPVANDYDYVYSDKLEFFVIKYDTESATFTLMNIGNLCVIKSQWYDDSVSGITGNDGKMYLQGCYTAAWKTLIFDPETETFQNKTVNIDHPISSNITMPYYRQSQLTVIDDNILLLLYKNSHDNSISLHIAITDMISINFTDTISTNVWPSEGFHLMYYLNDFSNYSNDLNIMYPMIFYSDETMDGIYADIVLNTSNDSCICNTTIYNCHSCWQHFDLKHYLSLPDNDVMELKFIAISKHFHALILPKYITIQLQRCIISFMDLVLSTAGNNPAINFTFALSSNCYSRVDTEYSLSITASSLNLFAKLFIKIVTNTTKTGKVCYMNSVRCTQFNRSSFVIYHETEGIEDGLFDVVIESDMIDFRLNTSSINTLQYITPKKKKKITEENTYEIQSH